MRSMRRVTRNEFLPFLIDIHYAHRVPSVTHSFGLEIDGRIEGVICYGTPPSASLRVGICGKDLSHYVVELNRLCLKNNRKNDASWLISRSLKELGDCIVVSFADPSAGHVGKVYQAANFLYCGLSAKRTDWAVKGREHLHGQTIADEFRGKPNRVQMMRDKYGSDFYLKPRPRKHRYVYIAGSRKFKKLAMNNLRYKIEEYLT